MPCCVLKKCDNNTRNSKKTDGITYHTLRFKRDYRLIVRCLSDKPSDSDGKTPDNKVNTQDANKKTPESSTEKIQALLKLMMAEPKIKDSEYREKFATAPEIPRRHKQNIDEIEVKTEKIEDSITKAAGEVAQALGGDVKQTEGELLSKVLGKINQNTTSLSDLIIGMKVDRTQESDGVRTSDRGQQVKRIAEKSKFEAHRNTRFSQRRDRLSDHPSQDRRNLQQPISVDIFAGEPLGIFKAKEPNYGTDLPVWDKLNQRELMLATSQPPANYFQKMIQWTEQGKVWQFPINNEQGMEEEQHIHFSEHIFLDAHLEDWCPRKGPIRHFMELVCVGLSKNPFYTVQEKKDHIMWYKEYFESKKDLLTEVGAWDIQNSTSTEAST